MNNFEDVEQIIEDLSSSFINVQVNFEEGYTLVMNTILP